MKDEVETPEDAAYIKAQIAEVQSQHLSDLQRIHTVQAEEYLDEAWARYLSKDDTQYLVQGENNPTALESYAKLDVSPYHFGD